MARFIGCDGPHEEPTEWEWQIVRRDGAVNTMLCDQHFGEWIMALVAPGESPADGTEVVPQDLDGADPGPPAVVDVELPDLISLDELAKDAADDEAAAAAERAAAEHEVRTARRLAARKSGAATSEAVAPWPGESDG